MNSSVHLNNLRVSYRLKAAKVIDMILLRSQLFSLIFFLIFLIEKSVSIENEQETKETKVISEKACK